MASTLRIVQAYRQLLLPCLVEYERLATAVLRQQLNAIGVPLQDRLRWLTLESDKWSAGHRGNQFTTLVEAVIAVSDPNYGNRFSSSYFTLHGALCSDFGYDNTSARVLLNHGFLICWLADRERMSAAHIARIISARNPASGASRQAISRILTGLGLAPTITESQINEMFSDDAMEEPPAFSDADLTTAASLVEEKASRLGVGLGFRRALLDLAPTADGTRTHTPYLQILHFQCCVADLFDHAVTDMYEFRPRGAAVSALLTHYRPPLNGAGNPFLNNLKAVESLDAGWVRSKKANERLGAAALFNILSSMDSLSFAGRRELARWVRLWIHRIMRLATPHAVLLPMQLSANQVSRFLAGVSARNTETFGILEQRTVEAINSLRYATGSQWRSRGVGDPVNATNVSKRKLGDCDYQDSQAFIINAFESHGGRLSEVYYQEHLRTLNQVCLARANELSAISDITAWRATVTFVAHALPAVAAHDQTIHGVRTRIEMITFNDFINAASAEPSLGNAIEVYVLQELRQARIPDSVRRQFVSMIGAI